MWLEFFSKTFKGTHVNIKCNVTVFSVFQSSEVKGRLSALEAQLESLLSGLDRLSILEKRLEELDRWRNTEKVDSLLL